MQALVKLKTGGEEGDKGEGKDRRRGGVMDVQTIYSSQLYRSRWIFSPAGLAWRMEGGRAGVIDAERER